MNVEQTITAAAIYRHPVAYADTDAGGIVYHSRYLEIAERARNQLLVALGFNNARLTGGSGIMFVVRKAAMTFEAPATLDHILTVTTSLLLCEPSRTGWLTRFSHEAAPIAAVTLELVAVNIIDRSIRRHPDGLLEALRPFLRP